MSHTVPMPEPEGQWVKRVHACTLPEIPHDYEHGSEWQCSCGQIWEVAPQMDPHDVTKKVFRRKAQHIYRVGGLDSGGSTGGGVTWDCTRRPI